MSDEWESALKGQSNQTGAGKNWIALTGRIIIRVSEPRALPSANMVIGFQMNFDDNRSVEARVKCQALVSTPITRPISFGLATARCSESDGFPRAPARRYPRSERGGGLTKNAFECAIELCQRLKADIVCNLTDP